MNEASETVLNFLDGQIEKFTKLSIATPIRFTLVYLRYYLLQKDFVQFVQQNFKELPLSEVKRDELLNLKNEIVQVLNMILEETSTCKEKYYLDACEEVKIVYDGVCSLIEASNN